MTVRTVLQNKMKIKYQNDVEREEMVEFVLDSINLMSVVHINIKNKIWTLSIWTSVRPLTRSATTSFSLNWKDTDLMGGLFGV